MEKKMKKSYSEKILSLHQNHLKKDTNEIKNSIEKKAIRSVSDKSMHHDNYDNHKTKKNKNENDPRNKKACDRFLIEVNVFGSTGPIRFIAKSDDNAITVIETTLKIYARQGRLPVLGSDKSSFFLYPSNAGFDVKPLEAIGSCGVRNFVLCKNQTKPLMTETRSHAVETKAQGWSAWLHKSLTRKITSH